MFQTRILDVPLEMEEKDRVLRLHHYSLHRASPTWGFSKQYVTPGGFQLLASKPLLQKLGFTLMDESHPLFHKVVPGPDWHRDVHCGLDPVGKAFVFFFDVYNGNGKRVLRQAYTEKSDYPDSLMFWS